MTIFNPYTPGVLFTGHRQLVQNQIRQIHVPPNSPIFGNELVQWLRVENSTRRKSQRL